jgi:hypothetical protein
LNNQMNTHFSISSQMNIHLVIHLDNQMNIHLVIHLDNCWVCCPALRLGTSAAFCKWGLLECMLLSSSVLIPPANARPGRARSSAAPAAPAATRTTGPAAPAVPGLQLRCPRQHRAPGSSVKILGKVGGWEGGGAGPRRTQTLGELQPGSQ